jgi:long-subunit fatty acid transport protein
MMEQGTLFEDMPIKDKSDEVCIGGRLFLKFNKNDPNKVCLFNRDTPIKMVDLTTTAAYKVVDNRN